MQKIKVIILLLAIIGSLNAGINYLKSWHAGYELQKINHDMMEACTIYLQQNPSGYCD